MSGAPLQDLKTHRDRLVVEVEELQLRQEIQQLELRRARAAGVVAAGAQGEPSAATALARPAEREEDGHGQDGSM